MTPDSSTQAVGGWMLIESAPKDGTTFLACWGPSRPYHITEACWSGYHPNAKGKVCWRTAPNCGNKVEGITHWQPRPEPPA